MRAVPIILTHRITPIRLLMEQTVVGRMTVMVISPSGGNGDFSKFTGVKVDGNLIDKSNYTAKEGSTIITLKASYLNTLSAGTHTVEILWTDDSASTTFTIKANTSDNSNNNQNDNNNSDSSDDKPSSGELIRRM